MSRKKGKFQSVELAIDALIETYWNQIEYWTKHAEEKAAHVERLRQNRQTPIFRDHYPNALWESISEAHAIINALTALKINLQRSKTCYSGTEEDARIENVRLRNSLGSILRASAVREPPEVIHKLASDALARDSNETGIANSAD